MKITLVISAIIDALAQLLFINILNAFSLSVYGIKLQINLYLIIGGVGAFLFSVAYLLILLQEKSAKDIITFSVINTLCYLVFGIVFFVLQIEKPFVIFPIGDVNAANGLIIIFTTIFFVILTSLLRIIVFICMLIRTIGRRTRDGSAS